MSILCCRRNSSASVHTPQIQIQPPKILRRLSVITSHAQASPRTIEAFYNEGKELLQARQEESERSSLRIAMQTSYEAAIKDLNADVPDDDATKSGTLDPLTTVEADELFDNRQSQLLIFGQDSTPSIHGIRLPPKSSSANELHSKSLIAPVSRNIHGTLTLGKSMPLLRGAQSKAAQEVPQFISPSSRICLRLQTSPGKISKDIPSLKLPAKIVRSKKPVKSTTPICMPLTPGLSPYLMPSIATTIVSINEGSGTASQDDRLPSNKNSTHDVTNAQTLDNQRKQTTGFGGGEVSLDCTVIETEKKSVAATDLPKKERKPSNDTTISNECFMPNEFFSKIPVWVRPSTSTFMSSPSSDDPNRSRGLGMPLNSSSTVPAPPNSSFSEFYSSLETPATGNTGTSTPSFIRPPTPRYHFRPSMDNASSFYPSRETSRCQSLVDSIESPLGLSDAPMWSASAAHTSSRTPRPSDRVNISAQPQHATFGFPWKTRSPNKSPEPITNQDAFTRSSSLAHLKKNQKWSRDLQRMPRVKPQGPTKDSQPEGPLAQKYSEGYENFQLQGCITTHKASPYLGHIPPNKKHWHTNDNGNKERPESGPTVSPAEIVNNTDHSNWVKFPARISSLPVPHGATKDSRNWRSPHTWKSRNQNNNNFSNSYGKSEQKASLRNSVSLGEGVWGQNGLRNRLQDKSRKASMAGMFTGPMSDVESQDGGDEKDGLAHKRDMIRSRSMTLRKTFTNSIAKLRGRVSFNGSSKVSSPSKSVNKERFYQMRHEGQRPISYTPVLNEKTEVEPDASKSDISSIIFRPTLPKEMIVLESSREFSRDTSPGNGNIIQRSDIELRHDSPLSLITSSPDRSEFSTASERLKTRPWSTVYDDCVTFPFAEDEVGGDNGVLIDNELETPMSGFVDAPEK